VEPASVLTTDKIDELLVSTDFDFKLIIHFRSIIFHQPEVTLDRLYFDKTTRPEVALANGRGKKEGKRLKEGAGKRAVKVRAFDTRRRLSMTSVSRDGQLQVKYLWLARKRERERERESETVACAQCSQAVVALS
jgi:hypothetical protein